MKILLLQGNPVQESTFDDYVVNLKSVCEARGFEVDLEILREKDIRPCTGCFKCWIKTPGECVLHDDAVDLAKKYIASDFVLLASPLILGYFSALLKNTLDRSIPLMHPHLENVDREMHHKKRYESYPKIGVLLQREASTDNDDLEIVEDLFKRMCINMRTEPAFFKLTDETAEEVANAINIH